jgi:hypothetical protein
LIKWLIFLVQTLARRCRAWRHHNSPCLLNGGELTTGFTDICFESDDFEGDCAHVLGQGAIPDSLTDLDITNCKTAAFKDLEGNRFMLIAFNDPSDLKSISSAQHKDILARVAAQLL